MQKWATFFATVLVALGVVAAANAAAGEQTSARISKTQLAINPKTCKFLHSEQDPIVPPTGHSLGTVITSLRMNRTYDVYEDARHDAKMACLTHHMGQRGPRGATGARGPAGPAGPAGPSGSGLAGYVQVKATGTGKTVTAVCPVGDVVLGGGSPDEVAGSWPNGSRAWTIARDHLSPHTMTVIATCAKAAA